MIKQNVFSWLTFMKSSLSKHNDDVPYKWTGSEFSAVVSMINELKCQLQRLLLLTHSVRLPRSQ